MQKTRLGLSVGLLGAAMVLSCLVGGYTISILLAGYILLFEENVWLKQTTVKAVAIMFGFSILYVLCNLIPNAIGVIDSLFRAFGGEFHLNFISSIISAIHGVCNILENILLIVLALKAFNQGTISIPMIDSLVSKFMD